uniref:Uncharacterized protein n=1 Tax=Nelumbo nucifera TaxID=4432 RepID=A0A822XU35_NELNU|nr:TPA_asm: hypothetical protein HUJ06_026598 [Nelumbo nucifera]
MKEHGKEDSREQQRSRRFRTEFIFPFFEHGEEDGREQSTGWLMEEHREEDYRRFQTEE